MKKLKFKIGDKVRITNTDYSLKRKYIGKIYTIFRINSESEKAYVLNDNSIFRWFEYELELVNKSKFFKTLPDDYTGTIEVENGYIVQNEVLDEAEKEYLKAVIRPFKNSVKYIKKKKNSKEYIRIELDTEYFSLPYFEPDTMYKGMKIEKQYTLKELGLDE